MTLAVGEHVRLARTYRGRDIQGWMHAAGVLDQRIETVGDPDRARRVSSPQLVGTVERRTLDLDTLQGRGVEIVGRLAGVREGTAQFSGSLRHDRGVVEARGLHALGLPFLRRRKSSFIHGAEDDVRELTYQLCDLLDRTAHVASGPCGPVATKPRCPERGASVAMAGRCD